MDVALLYPEVYDMARFKDERKEFPPFGVLYLAAVLEQAGHRAQIQAVTPARTDLDLTGFDAVGFSLASSATYGMMLATRRRSRLAPGTLVMVGGVHAGFYPVESLTDFDAHAVAAGESEPIIVDLLEAWSQRGGDFTAIPGIYWPGPGGGIVAGPKLTLMKDIDELPLPAGTCSRGTTWCWPTVSPAPTPGWRT